MPVVSQPYVWKQNDVATATLMNANPAGFVTALNNIDNGNIGAAGIYAAQIIPTTTAQGIFGGTVNYQTPRSLVIPSGSAYAYGLLFTTATGMGVYAGTGVPTISAPNGSLALRYDGASLGASIYLNNSGPSTTGTTWTALSASGGPFILSASTTFSNVTTNNGSAKTLGGPLTLHLTGSPNTSWRVEALGSVSVTAAGSSSSIAITGTTTASGNAIANKPGSGSFSGNFTNTLAETALVTSSGATAPLSGNVLYGGDFNTLYGDVTLTLQYFESGATTAASGFFRILAFAI